MSDRGPAPGGNHRRPGNHSTLWTAGALILVFLLGACSTGLEITAGDDGTSVELSRGEEFEIVLPANPSTGYLWVVTDPSPVIESVGEPVFQPDSDLVWASRMYRLRFVVRQPGTVQLHLRYERPFEEVEPLDTFEILVTVD